MAKHRDDPRRSPFELDDDEMDELEELEEEPAAVQAPRLRRYRRGNGGSRESARETAVHLVRDIPNFGKLLVRLARDPRVSRLDKALVLAAVGYMVLPVDVLPDIPVIGQVDDVFLLALTLDRLLNNAGIDVLLDHWDGDMESLELALAALDRASAVLPERLRGLLGQRL